MFPVHTMVPSIDTVTDFHTDRFCDEKNCTLSQSIFFGPIIHNGVVGQTLFPTVAELILTTPSIGERNVSHARLFCSV